MISTLKKILESNPKVKQITLVLYRSTLGAYYHRKENKNFLKNGKKVLKQADIAFKEIGVNYWLEFGTLLGAIRNKDFIKHDLDLDFGMFLKDYSKNNEAILKKHGFKKIRSFTIDNGEYGREESYCYLGVTIDIFYFTKIPDSNQAYCHLFKPLEGKSRDKTIRELGGLIPKEFKLEIKSIGSIQFLNKEYPIPLASENHLTDIYGSSYMIEDPTWETGKGERTNVSILTDKVGIRKMY